MVEKKIFEEMINVYEKAIPEMGWFGEFDWCNAANETRKRINAYLHGEIQGISRQLARECHADLQGYVEVRFGSKLLDPKSCYDEDCFDLYKLGQHLVQTGGRP